jgi:hypothetical protein
MNKAILIVLVPALLVAVGYVLILQHMGYPPGYPRLIIAMTLFFGAIYGLSRRAARKARSNQP